MESSVIPGPVFVLLGAGIAALIAGFFSYLGMVSSKENKVSEFRLAWIDGLREEIATYNAALKGLLDVQIFRQDLAAENFSKASVEERELKWMEKCEDDYRKVIESLTKIQLRLNSEHAATPGRDEHRLMTAVMHARDLFNAGEYARAFDSCDDIANAAAPLLKKTWDEVKNGEEGYQRTRKDAKRAIRLGVILIPVAVLGTLLLYILLRVQSPASPKSGDLMTCIPTCSAVYSSVSSTSPRRDTNHAVPANSSGLEISEDPDMKGAAEIAGRPRLREFHNPHVRRGAAGEPVSACPPASTATP